MLKMTRYFICTVIYLSWFSSIKMDSNTNVFVHDDLDTHRQKCKVIKDHNFNAKGISMINSPVSILPAAFKLGVHPETSKSIDGLIKEDAANWVVMSWLLNQSKNGKHQHCIDIGSHVGSNMLHMASLGCYTHSFETNKTIAYLLNYNAHLNRLHDKIRVHNLALPSGILTASEFVSANLTDTNIDTFQSNQSKISNWHDCIPRHHNISLVRIDVAGDESDTLQGLQTVFKQEFVEALQIAVHPSTRQSLSKNFSRHLDIYIKQNFTLQVIVGNCKSCPRNLLPDNNKIDVALTGDAVLKVLPWDDLDTFSTAVSTGNFLCYLWITRHSIRERLQIYPLHHGLYKYLEGKPAKGAGSEVFYVTDNKKRSIPNMDTFASMKFKLSDIVQLGAVIDIIPTGDSIPPV